MFCTNCGKEFEGKFCPECGTSVVYKNADLIQSMEETMQFSGPDISEQSKPKKKINNGNGLKVASIILFVYGLVSIFVIAIPAFKTAVSTGIVSLAFCIACICVSAGLFNRYNEAHKTSSVLENGLIEKPGETIAKQAKTIEGSGEAIEKRTTFTENFKVAGVAHYEENILSMGFENSEYFYTKKELIDSNLEDSRIYEYEFLPSNIELVEEPDNPYDKNAIKVIIDDIHVGYIKSGSCSRVKNLLKSGTVSAISAEIYGGNYKLLYLDDDEKYQVETGSSHIGVKVSISYNK